jgi:hypothetical protein
MRSGDGGRSLGRQGISLAPQGGNFTQQAFPGSGRRERIVGNTGAVHGAVTQRCRGFPRPAPRPWFVP